MKIMIFFGALLLLFVGIANALIEDNRMSVKLRSISVGMPKQQVIRLLGVPHSVVGKECEWPGVLPRKAGCSELFVYWPPLAPLLPHYPAVWFDMQGKVMDTYDIQSP